MSLLPLLALQLALAPADTAIHVQLHFIAPPAAATGVEPMPTEPPPGLLTIPAQDTVRHRAIQYSDWYTRRLTIHQWASWAMLPLAVGEAIVGQKLYNVQGGSDPALKSTHQALATGIEVLFAANTITGGWNFWDARHDPNGGKRRWIHGLSMLVADGLFLAAAASAPGDDCHESGGVCPPELAACRDPPDPGVHRLRDLDRELAHDAHLEGLMIALPQSLIDLVQPWATLYGDSSAVSDGVTFLHFAGLLIAGGAAVAVDRETLATAAGDIATRARVIATIRAVHRWVLIGLGLTVLSGIGLLTSDLKTFWEAPAYWVKMGLFLLLLLNGVWLQRNERGADPTAAGPWARIRWAAGISLTLWFAILFTSILVTTAA